MSSASSIAAVSDWPFGTTRLTSPMDSASLASTDRPAADSIGKRAVTCYMQQMTSENEIERSSQAHNGLQPDCAAVNQRHPKAPAEDAHCCVIVHHAQVTP